MTLFGFCHAQKNGFAFFVALSFREIAVGLRGLDFRLPVAHCSIDRLAMIFLPGGHVALKPNEMRFPMRSCYGEVETTVPRGEFGLIRRLHCSPQGRLDTSS